MAGNYGIIDWAFEALDDEVIKNIDDVKEAINDYAKNSGDGGVRWTAFTNVKPDWINITSKTGKSINIGEEVERVNVEYATGVEKEIESEEQIPELKSIEIDKDYEEETVSGLIEKQEQKIEENEGFDEFIAEKIENARAPKKIRSWRSKALTQRTRDIANEKLSVYETTTSDYFEEIRSASTEQELDDLRTEIQDASTIGDKAKNSLITGIGYRKQDIQ